MKLGGAGVHPRGKHTVKNLLAVADNGIGLGSKDSREALTKSGGKICEATHAMPQLRTAPPERHGMTLRWSTYCQNWVGCYVGRDWMVYAFRAMDHVIVRSKDNTAIFPSVGHVMFMPGG